MFLKVSKFEIGSTIEGCSCREGKIAKFEGKPSKNDLVVFCMCGKRYLATQSGTLVEGSNQNFGEVLIPDAEVTP